MITFVFDTLKAAKALRDAGFEEAQAEAVVATVGEAMGENVATKADIDAVRIEMAGLRADIANEFKAFYRHLLAYGHRDRRPHGRAGEVDSVTVLLTVSSQSIARVRHGHHRARLPGRGGRGDDRQSQ